jgi:translocation and assembly module TamB
MCRSALLFEMATPPKRPSRRWPIALAMGIAGMPVAALVVAWAAVRSEAGTRWLLAQVPGLEASGVRGSLLGESLAVDRLHWQGTSQQPTLQIDGLRWHAPAWRVDPHAGAWVALGLQRLQATRVQWRSPAEPLAASAPSQLRLPFALGVDALQIDELQVDAQSLRSVQGRVQLGAREGSEHRVDVESLQFARARASGIARIAADAPMVLAIDLQASAVGGTPWQASLQASGPLAAFDVKAQLRGDASAGAQAPRLDAQARIEPFAAWPIGTLQATTQDLDLAALASGAPQTRLRGEAQVQSAGLDTPGRVSLTVENTLPGRWDARRIPVRQLALTLRGTPRQLDRLDIERVDALLHDERAGAGRLDGRGRWEGARLQLQLQARLVQPDRLDTRAGPMTLSGPLALDLTGVPVPTQRGAATPAAPWRMRVQADLAGSVGSRTVPVRAEFGADIAADEFDLTRFIVSSGDASASGRLRWQRSGVAAQREWALRGDGELARFDPLVWWPGEAGSAWARGGHRLDGRWQLDLRLPDRAPALARRDAVAAAQTLRGQAALQLDDSRLAGVPFSTALQLRADSSRLGLAATAHAAGNRVALDGQLAERGADDRWQLDLQAPALAELQPLLNLLGGAVASPVQGLRGELRGSAQLAGRWPVVRTEGQAHVRALVWRATRIEQGDLNWRLEPGDAGALQLQATLTNGQQGEQRVDVLQASIDGTRADHELRLQVDSPLRPPAWTEPLLGATTGGLRAVLEGQGRWQSEPGGGRWRALQAALRVGARQDQAAPWLEVSGLQAEIALDPGGVPRHARLAPGRAGLPGGAALRWTDAEWRAGAPGAGDIPGADSLRLHGELEPLAIAPLLAKLQPDLGWAGDLTLAGRLDIRAEQRFDADIVVERAAGDLRIADESGAAQMLGLTDLRLAFTAHDGLWQFAQGAAGRQLGEMAGSQVVRTDASLRWPARDAPLEGVVEMRVANLGAWGVWVPPGWRLGGSLQLSGELGGRFGAPEVRGRLRGSALSVRNALQGVGISDGELEATLDGAVARVQRFEFKGGDGQLRLAGEAALGENPSATLQMQAERFRVLGRIDRRLVTSGQAELRLTREQLKLDGQFRFDEGFIDFSRGDAPSLDDDVRVARPPGNGGAAATAEREARPVPAPLRNAQVTLAIDLGEQVQVRGRGLDARLRGDLRLATPGGRLAVNGTVRAVSGTYLAYAQKMSIERGELVFTGAAENPRLDIIAVRPNIDARVGVAVSGTLANPRVRLFSEPEMTEIDKLSWLVLGRPSDGLGGTDTALLQRAAVALLAGEDQAPTDQLLQQLGISDFSLRQTEGTTRETIVSLGRQLSQRWYLGYERSVNATTGTWQLIYRVAQRVTVRAQSGVESALDVIWSWRWN